MSFSEDWRAAWRELYPNLDERIKAVWDTPDTTEQPHRCEVCGREISHPGTCADCELSIAEMRSLSEQNRRRALGIDVSNMKES